MAPAKFVGLGTRVPGVAPLLEVNGQIRYTAIKIMAPQFTNGKMSVYEENGHCSLGVHGKTFKLFKLSKNIQSFSTRAHHITIVLNDGYQIIAKECAQEDIEIFESCLSKIKTFGSLKGWMGNKKENSSTSCDAKSNILEGPKKFMMKMKKKSPFLLKRKKTSPQLYETPSKSPISRSKAVEKVKGRLLESPLSNKENAHGNHGIKYEKLESITIEDEEVSNITTPKQFGSWSRPPGEQRNHSPGLRYGCSPLGFNTIRTKSPKSKRRHVDQSAFSPNDFFDEENTCPSSRSRTPKSLKRTYSSRKSASPSPLRPKVLQLENNTSMQDVSPGQDVTHKPSSFYGSSKAPSILPSLTGKMFRSFNWMGKGLRRQTPLQEKPIATFKKKEVQADESNLTNQITLTGFANLGNTCYMNAILQCLLGIPVFAHDLSNPYLIQNVSNASLYRCLHTLAQAKRNSEAQEKQRLILKTVKKAISNQATRFSGYMQHDAHEFLGQCLDQLKEDIIKSVLSEADRKDVIEIANTEERRARELACPVARNFECQISHTIKCDVCENQITKEETFYDFSLDIPEIDENTDPEDKDIQELLQDYFEEETIGYKCEKCECESAHLSHYISKLPRVMILHLKRYEIDEDFSRYRKKLDTVDVPLEINLGILCTDNTKKPLNFEKTPRGGVKRPVSNETPDDICDFQPSYKARRKLALPMNPILSDPEVEDTSLDFERDIEKAKKLSLDHASEQEQLEWALAESMKTGHQEKGIIWDKDHVTPPFPNVDGNGYENGACTDVNKEKNSTETFTGLKDRQKQPVENDFIEFKPENEVKNNSISEWLSTQEKLNENEDDAVLMEGLSQLENEDDQLKMALELSLKEYNESSAQKPMLTQMRCKSNKPVGTNEKSKKRKASEDVNAAPRKYRLIGVVSHIGDSSSAGHYISDVYDCKENEWKSYNDSSVKKTTEYEVRYARKRSAYIFFYIEEDCFKVITTK